MYYIHKDSCDVVKAERFNTGYIIDNGSELIPVNKEVFEAEYTLAVTPTLDDKINFILECKLKTDCDDNYSIGLYNGLELALSILTNREPQYKPCKPDEAAEAHETLIDCLLSCFSNDDLKRQIELRKSLGEQELDDYIQKEQVIENISDKDKNIYFGE
jgi:hypothetical protein